MALQPPETHLRATQPLQADVAFHGLYEVSKLLAANSAPRSELTSVLNVMCCFWELHAAAIAWKDGERAVDVVRAGRSKAEEGGPMDALLRQACGLRIPWIVESEWCEPVLEGLAQRPCSELDLDRSFVSVPLRQKEAVHGALCIERMHGPGDQRLFRFDNDVRLLSAIANMIVSSAASPPANERAAAAESADVADPQDGRHCTQKKTLRASRAHRSRGPDRNGDSILGEHAKWLSAVSRARTAARTSATILLRGESGTGKELLARAVHDASPRRDAPYVSLNCAALSESVLESELFGHERGAFTGAVAQRQGRFEQADGGTLFLDEIGEISGAFQASLLRVLQVGEFERVGGTTTLHVDVRVVAATHRNLEEEVRRGRFRSDLYYRLCVVPIVLPPLRERTSDIPLLAEAFLRRFNVENGTDLRLHESAIELLSRCPFFGNVRELENAICRAGAFARRPQLTAPDFDWLEDALPVGTSSRGGFSGSSRRAVGPTATDPAGDATARDRLIDAMDRAGWVQAKAARLLNVTPRQLGYALRKHHVRVRKF